MSSWTLLKTATLSSSGTWRCMPALSYFSGSHCMGGRTQAVAIENDFRWLVECNEEDGQHLLEDQVRVVSMILAYRGLDRNVDDDELR